MREAKLSPYFFLLSLQNTVDKLVQRANASLIIGTSSWKEQFVEALTVSPGSDVADDDSDAESGGGIIEKSPSTLDYIMHVLTVFWKLIFAFVPPTGNLSLKHFFFLEPLWQSEKSNRHRHNGSKRSVRARILHITEPLPCKIS